MTEPARRGGVAIFMTLVTALILQTFPMPDWAEQLCPAWSLLVLIYWTMAIPHRIGIISAFLVGLTVDSMNGSLIGQHALSYSICIYVAHLYYKRLRLSMVWQQTLAILGLLLLERMVSAMVLGITRGQTPDSIFWASAIVSMVLWPWIFIVLRDVRRRFGIS